MDDIDHAGAVRSNHFEQRDQCARPIVDGDVNAEEPSGRSQTVLDDVREK